MAWNEPSCMAAEKRRFIYSKLHGVAENTYTVGPTIGKMQI